MIHEVMVLDHSGPLFAAVEYATALKLWVQGSLLVGLLVPLRGHAPGVDLAAYLGGMLLLGVAVGVVESTRARLRLPRVPQLLVGAAAMGAVALALSLR
jgi:formate hydrogenlyase subunit 4